MTIAKWNTKGERERNNHMGVFVTEMRKKLAGFCKSQHASAMAESQRGNGSDPDAEADVIETHNERH